jgi:selenide,water dikinase
MNRDAPVRTDIVLLGGGHAHVHVLAAFAKLPEPGLRLTLVSRDLETPYSGMLPGVIAGLYAPEEAHIDLVRLAAATGARLVHAEAVGIDRAAKRVQLAGRPPIAYDILSIDVGISPALSSIAGAEEHGIAVKPIGSFLNKFNGLLEGCRKPGGPRRIAVIGGGAGGAELLLSLRARLLADAAAEGRDARAFVFCLATEDEILPSHNEAVREALRRAFARRGIALHERRKVLALRPGAIDTASGAIEADAVFLATHAAAPAWLAETGLAVDAGGFVSVGPGLQSLNDPDVFAAGDCAALVETPREKAGVYAVRAGPPLAENLRRRALGLPAKPWRPQRRHLALISTGERYAVASRGWFKAEGAWLWTLKDWIDRRWMRMYRDTDAMLARMAAHAPAAGSPQAAAQEMRCGGCGAKIGPGPLGRVLKRLPPAAKTDSVILGLQSPDDAAVLVAPKGRHVVETVDFFRAFIGDAYRFGEIAANHALNDIFAMGGVPRHALALATVPPALGGKVEEELFQLLAGARATLDREDVALVGGHSSEGAELALGFSVSGEVDPAGIMRKSGLRGGDALILTRPIGTGILFAAAMRAKAPAASIDAALSEMRRSNRRAAEILIGHGAGALTDVSGFGLGGHLGEMLAASAACAQLDLAALPLYPQAMRLARAGIASSLLAENLELARLVEGAADAAARALLFDPQTAGGMIAGVAPDRAADCVAELRAAGHAAASAVGRVVETGVSMERAKIALANALRD